MRPLRKPWPLVVSELQGLLAVVGASERAGATIAFGKSLEERTMGEFTDKLDAAGNKIAGKVKEVIGSVTGNEKLEAEGDAQQLKGSAQDIKGSVKGALGDKL